MICEKRRIAYCKFPAEDLIYAPNDMIGKHCGARQTILLKVIFNIISSSIIIIHLVYVGLLLRIKTPVV